MVKSRMWLHSLADLPYDREDDRTANVRAYLTRDRKDVKAAASEATKKNSVDALNI